MFPLTTKHTVVGATILLVKTAVVKSQNKPLPILILDLVMQAMFFKDYFIPYVPDKCIKPVCFFFGFAFCCNTVKRPQTMGTIDIIHLNFHV